MEVLRTRRIDLESFFGKTVSRRSSSAPHTETSVPPSSSFDFRVLFDNAYDAILVADQTGRVFTSNRRAHAFFRDAPEEVADSSLVNLIPGMTPELINSIVETVATRRFTVLQAWCQRFDNTLFPAEVVVTGSVQGEQCTLFLQIRDATVRREAEEKLLSVTRALNTSAIGIGTADLDGVITYANPYLAEKLGVKDVEELIKQPLANFFGENNVCDEILAAVRENKVWSDEISMLVDGQVLWMQIDAAPHQDSEGVLTGLVFSVRDTGLRKRAEAAEYQASRNRLLMESMSATCHLLGQPATVLLSSLELIRARDPIDAEKDRSLFEMVFEAAGEMREVLQKMHAQSMTLSEEKDAGQVACATLPLPSQDAGQS